MARPTTLPEPWKTMAEAYGGVAKLAAACGVTYQTLERWARGDFQPRASIRKTVNALARRRRITPLPFAEDP